MRSYLHSAPSFGMVPFGEFPSGKREEEEAQESIELGDRVTPDIERRTAARSQALKPANPETSVEGGATAGGLRALRGATTSFAGKSSEGRNPKSASGTKQGRRTSGGASRQEGEKP